MKTALLIIDMQSYFAPMTTHILPNILKLASFFQNNSYPILCTQHGHPPSDFEPPIKNQLVRKWGAEGSIHTDTPEWQLQPQIAELLSSPNNSESTSTIPKNTYDAFHSTPLETQLRLLHVERVVICGVMTDCCCDTTARSAFNKGFETWMVGDACASANRRQHERALGVWGFGYGDVVGVEEGLRRLEGERG